MKKTTIIIMAWALLMSLSQCKKDVQPLPDNTDEGVTITLNVRGSNGSRVGVVPEDGTVAFESGDKIYVASAGQYVGVLTCDGTIFSGVITNATTGYPLDFYFLGNKTPVFNDDNTSCSIDISDQSDSYWGDRWHLPVISSGSSVELFGSGTSYSACLLNKCALAKFVVNTTSEADVYIADVNHLVTIDFSNASFEYGKYGNGYINMGTGSGEKWCILLPQDAVEAGQMGSAYSNGYIGNHGDIPAISANSFISNGITVTVTTAVGNSEAPEGAICGKFSINQNGDQVYFSQGNLQYQASTSTWRFAENQWDYVGTQVPDNNGYYGGTVSGSTNVNISQNYSGWIDLFGWGTSGYNHGANCYQPWGTSTSDVDYHAYGISSYSLYSQTGQADWGYNSISNGGNQENQWRTLTLSEWQYVFNSRTTSSGILFVKAQLNGVNGVILLPDDWQTNYYCFAAGSENSSTAPYTSNVFVSNTGEWENLQANGAVFMPAAGTRHNTSVFNASIIGRYWSSSINYSYFYGYHVRCLYYAADGIAFGIEGRHYGCSVRLVKDCNAAK